MLVSLSTFSSPPSDQVWSASAAKIVAAATAIISAAELKILEKDILPPV
jgi:hypothetical protein